MTGCARIFWMETMAEFQIVQKIVSALNIMIATNANIKKSCKVKTMVNSMPLLGVL
jgi:hypothetical protein